MIRFPTESIRGKETLIGFAIRLLTAYFLGAGVLLAVAPWTSWWERNLFAALVPDLSFWMSNVLVRAAVSGVGLLTLATGIVDWRAWRVPPSPAPRDS